MQEYLREETLLRGSQAMGRRFWARQALAHLVGRKCAELLEGMKNCTDADEVEQGALVLASP